MTDNFSHSKDVAMFSDPWIRRLSWLGSVALVLVSGAMLKAQDVFQVRDVAAVAKKAPAYWLGLVCDPADAAIRSQLKLKDAGLIVREVVPDTPAAKAGLKQHDVLLAAGDQKIDSLEKLVALVNQAGEKELTLQLVREGKKITAKVRPAKRPALIDLRNLPPDAHRIFQLHGQKGPDGRWQFNKVRPDVITRRLKGRVTHHLEVKRFSYKLPKDMRVTISKQGDEPAKIVVKKGYIKWEVTEDKLDKLPEDVRKHVKSLLNPGAKFLPSVKFGMAFSKKPVQFWVPNISGPRPLEPQPRSDGQKRLEKRVDELSKQIQELRKAIQGLSKDTSKSSDK